jgi:hypothetical protein
MRFGARNRDFRDGVIFASFSTQSTLIGHPQTEEIRDPLGHA